MAITDEIHVGATIVFKASIRRTVGGVTTPYSLASVTLVEFLFMSPGGRRSAQTAAIDDEGLGLISFTAPPSLLDRPGKWSQQVRLTEGSVVIPSNVVHFQCFANAR